MSQQPPGALRGASGGAPQLRLLWQRGVARPLESSYCVSLRTRMSEPGASVTKPPSRQLRCLAETTGPPAPSPERDLHARPQHIDEYEPSEPVVHGSDESFVRDQVALVKPC